MGVNTIGTGAVVLTANADALVDGLEKADRAARGWAKKTTVGVSKELFDPTETLNKAAYKLLVGRGEIRAEYMRDVNYTLDATGKLIAGLDKKAKGKGDEKGGWLRKFMLGAGAGATLAAVGVAFGVASRLGNVQERSRAYSDIGVGTARDAGIDRADKAMFRIGAAADEFLFTVAGKLAPGIERIASVLEVVGFVGGEVFSIIVDEVGNVVGAISGWIDETFGLATATTSAGDQAFAVLRLIGKGVAYYFDMMKANVGVVSLVVGVVVDGFGQILQVIATATRSLAALAAELPEAIRPTWIAGAANAVDGFGKKVEGVGAGMQKWGKDAIAGFGNSSGAVGQWFDGVEGRFKGTERLAKAFGQVTSGAFQKNSAEAYSVLAKFTAGNIVTGQTVENDPVKIAKRQLDETKQLKQTARFIQQIIGTFVPPKLLE